MELLVGTAPSVAGGDEDVNKEEESATDEGDWCSDVSSPKNILSSSDSSSSLKYTGKFDNAFDVMNSLSVSDKSSVSEAEIGGSIGGSICCCCCC